MSEITALSNTQFLVDAMASCNPVATRRSTSLTSPMPPMWDPAPTCPAVCTAPTRADCSWTASPSRRWSASAATWPPSTSSGPWRHRRIQAAEAGPRGVVDRIERRGANSSDTTRSKASPPRTAARRSSSPTTAPSGSPASSRRHRRSSSSRCWPIGSRIRGEFLVVDTTKLPPQTRQQTVSVKVG